MRVNDETQHPTAQNALASTCWESAAQSARLLLLGIATAKLRSRRIFPTQDVQMYSAWSDAQCILCLPAFLRNFWYIRILWNMLKDIIEYKLHCPLLLLALLLLHTTTLSVAIATAHCFTSAEQRIATQIDGHTLGLLILNSHTRKSPAKTLCNRGAAPMDIFVSHWTFPQTILFYNVLYGVWSQPLWHKCSSAAITNKKTASIELIRKQSSNNEPERTALIIEQ